MVVVDDDHVFREANAAACRLMRRASEDIVGRNLAEFTAPSHADELDAAWEDLMARRHVVRGWSVTDVDGHPVPISVAATCDIPEPGRHLGVILSMVGDAPAGAAQPRLSQREREITRLLAQGLSGERIARELFLSPETVRTHIRNAMEHVGARTRAHLVAIALRESLIEV